MINVDFHDILTLRLYDVQEMLIYFWCLQYFFIYYFVL